MGYRFLRAEEECLHALREYIEKNLSKNLSTLILCQEAGISYEKLNQGFQRLYGCSLCVFVTRLRMEEARRLLRDTDEAIKRISGLCGYKNVKSFHRAFRRFHGVTPRGMQMRESATK